MNKTTIWALIGGAILIIVGLTWYAYYNTDVFNEPVENVDTSEVQSEAPKQDNQETTEDSSKYTSVEGELIIVTSPTAGDSVSSPLEVTGEVPGNWSFEGSFPIVLLDSEGNELTSAIAKLQGDWMTDELVTFTAQLEFETQPPLSKGRVILKKDNPSGLTENDDSVEVDVIFK